MSIDSGTTIKKWKALEDRRLEGIEVPPHGAHDTENLKGIVSEPRREKVKSKPRH